MADQGGARLLVTTWWLLGDYLVTTWWSLGDHLVTTWWPLDDHLVTTLWLLGDHLVTTWWPLGDDFVTTSWLLGWWLLCDYLVTTWWLLGDYLVTTWWLLGDYLVTTCKLFGASSGACLGQHLGHIVNNGQQWTTICDAVFFCKDYCSHVFWTPFVVKPFLFDSQCAFLLPKPNERNCQKRAILISRTTEPEPPFCNSIKYLYTMYIVHCIFIAQCPHIVPRLTIKGAKHEIVWTNF